MKKTFAYILLSLLCLTAGAQTPTGLTCEDAIPVDSSFTFEVPAAGTYWFTAWTYDLPLGVHFAPLSDNSEEKPVATIDFTCEMGVYEDSLLASVLKDAGGWGIDVPIQFNFDLSVANGRNEYDLSVGKSYRETLARFGVTYNVQAFVMVEFPEAGTISMMPDSLFHDCMDHAHYMYMPDTFAIQPYDSSTVYVLPYSDWQNDSVRFVWKGAQDARIWVAAEGCNFEPSATDDYVWDWFDLPAGGSYKLDNATIRQTIKTHDAGGLFYAKVISPVADTLFVEQVPPQDVEGGAEALRYGRSHSLSALDTARVFYFPAGWGATEFASVTTDTFTMYWSNTAFFDATTAKGAFRFGKEGSYYKRYLSTKEMQDIEAKCGDYVYVRFLGKAASVLTPYSWSAGECADKTAQITMGETFAIASTSTAAGATIYRLRYSDFSAGNLTVTSAIPASIPVYIADTCAFSTSASDSHILSTFTLARRGSETLTDSAVVSWADRVDADGFLYMQFASSRAGNMVVSTLLPEPEPVPLAMIELHFDSTVVVSARDTLQHYYFSRTWDTQSVLFTAATTDSITAYFGCRSSYLISEDDPYYLGAKAFSLNGSQREMTLSEKDLQAFTARSASDQIFVRFFCASESPITPSEWEATPCSASSYELLTNDSALIPANRATEIYRIDYADWASDDVRLQWFGSKALEVYLSFACTYNASPSNIYVIKYAKLQQGDTVLITSELLKRYSYRVNSDGFFYLRFTCTGENMLYTSQHKTQQDTPSALPVSESTETTVNVSRQDDATYVSVTAEQDLELYDLLGHRLSAWHQSPADAPRRLSASVPGSLLILRGADSTIKILF